MEQDTDETGDGDSLQAQLLIAMPSMQDERFQRSVIFMCSHTADAGAMGLMINKQLPNLQFADLARQLDIEAENSPPITMHFGGPVETGRGFVLHSDDYHRDATVPMAEGVSMTATVDILRAMASGGCGAPYRHRPGHAFHAGGQGMSLQINARPFTIAVGDDVLDDLRARLARTRFPNEVEGGGWHYGADLTYMREMVRHWQTDYDWRKWEAVLNGFPNHVAEVDGFNIHFICEKGSGSNPTPLLVTHGWPGSVFEFHKIIEPLAHPERFGGDVADAFTVICQSLRWISCSSCPGAHPA